MFFMRSIIVSGFGRCGTSMVMQMLKAGGVPCLGDYPSFEDTRAASKDGLMAMKSQAYGKAVKVLDPQRVGMPLQGRVIWMERDHAQQAQSIAKFMRLVLGVKSLSDRQMDELRLQLSFDRGRAMSALYGMPKLCLHFEDVLAHPNESSKKIAGFIKPYVKTFDVGAAASQVLKRGPECQRTMIIETQLARKVA